MSTRPAAVMDLSKIDFAALARRFQEAKRKNLELEALKTAIRALLERLIRLNRTRVDFQEKFEELIEAYNTGSQNIEELFRALLELSRSLTQEQTRHVRENLTEEELTILDILTRPGPELTPAEREEVKRVARHLLERLKTILTFNWRQTTQARARVRMEIEDALDTGLPRAYAPEIYRAKCGAVFEHLYENYQGDGVSVFAAAG
jgi:type I restriction enzyme R subunit